MCAFSRGQSFWETERSLLLRRVQCKRPGNKKDLTESPGSDQVEIQKESEKTTAVLDI